MTAIEFDAVQPEPRRALYRHCYGIRGRVWAVHGHFERIYFISPDYVDGNLREFLTPTILSLWAVVRSELEAAIAAPMTPENEAMYRAAAGYIPLGPTP